jgi:type VI secretion system secreted protein Hcp
MARHNMFLKLTGQKTGVIKGEASEPGYAQQINVVDWSWGMTSPTGIGDGQATGRIRFDALRVVKHADTASTALMNVMRSNELLKVAELSILKAAGGTKPLDYFVVRLDQARIVSYKVESSMSDDGMPVLTEHVEFTFKSITVDFQGQDAKGNSTGSWSFTGDAFPDA